MAAIDWNKEFKPLLKQYGARKHPLDYHSPYQLLVMVILSAQDSDRHINSIAPGFFKKFPSIRALAKTDEASLLEALTGVRSGRNKARWLRELAATVKQDGHIPASMEELTALPGIGRKSANVIMRELGVKAEGVMVDLHVARVAPRLGVASGSDPKKIEQQLMDLLDRKLWSDIGMALSYLGRETCRPTNPRHDECVMRDVCAYCAARPACKAQPASKAKPAGKARPASKARPARKKPRAKK